MSNEFRCNLSVAQARALAAELLEAADALTKRAEFDAYYYVHGTGTEEHRPEFSFRVSLHDSDNAANRDDDTLSMRMDATTSDTKTVDVLAVVKRLAKEAEIALLDGAGIEEGEAVPQDIAEKIVGIWKDCESTSAVIDKLIGVADEAYAELLADSHRDGPRCLLLTRLEATLRAVGGAK